MSVLSVRQLIFCSCETKILNTSFMILTEELESMSKTRGLPIYHTAIP